jgi:cell division protein FtsI (penicillin-binding protein 3)
MATGNDHNATRMRSPHRDARRIYLIGGTLLAGLAVVAVRLVSLQIVHGQEYAEQARKQYESKVTLQAERGPLYDRNGNLLATNSTSYSFAVDPRHVENPRRLATAFAQACGESSDDWYRRITAKNTSFVWLKRKLTGDAMTMLKDFKDDGLIKIPEPVRHFEYASLGAQAIGYTDIDNNGLSGVELYYNQQLAGRSGFMVMQRDARGHRRPDVDLPQARPEHGDGLVLTIDINMQGIVEDELRKGVESAGATTGTAIALDPRTGEILAIASYPSFDPNDARSAEQSAIRVRAITDMYEPGSTMKLVTAAAALEEGAVAPDDSIDAEGGTYQLGSHTIRDDHQAGVISFREALEESSNIAFAKVASRLPAPRFYKYVRDFGFGIISGVDLPGEARGEVKKPNDFTEGTQEFMAFGYQLAVTPLQLVCAYAAVANDGVMMKPHLLKRRLNRDGEVIEQIEPQEIRQVISRKTADTLRRLLVGVVENGTGKQAHITGLDIAGKTGTSQQLSGGSYSKEKYNASFVGFFPAENPKVTLLVLLDSPTNGYYGGQVAAPIFREIARRIVNATMEGSQPPVQYASDIAAPAQPAKASAGNIHLPDLRGLDTEAARALCEKLGLRSMIQGEGRVVAAQRPVPGAMVGAGSVVTVGAVGADALRRMPDVRGMSLRRALNLLNLCRIRPQVVGSGIVRSQSVAPGRVLDEKMRITVLKCGQVERE